MENRYKKIGEADLISFIDDLAKDYPVYGPREKEGPVEAGDEYEFDEIESAEEISLKHPPTMVPPKKYFFPEKEDILEIQDADVEVPEEVEEFVIFGVHACDINSFLILDDMFSEDPFNDPYYERRRESSIVIGIDCEPTEYCFCKSMGTDKAEEGFDLFLTEVPDEDSYIVTIGTETGEELASDDIFESVDREFAEEVIENSLDWEEEESVNVRNLSDLARQSFGDEGVWAELGEECLGCGNCTMVCPCCNCFDVQDESSLESSKVTRKRTWEACTLLEFAEVSGGNFRESIDSRYRNWFYDKFRIFKEEIGEFGCVGCGRCIRACPVDIDPREVIQEVRDKYAG